jgi:GINS complex subunit 3
MKKASRVALPLWLAEMLAISPIGNSTPIALDLPDVFSAKIIHALSADARVVDLRALIPYFYAFGARCLELMDEENMAEILSDAFKKRAALIADHAHNPKGALGSGAEFLRGLDELERQLFRGAHDSTASVRSWASESKK